MISRLAAAVLALSVALAPASVPAREATPAPAAAPIPLAVNADVTQDLENILLLDLSNGKRVAIRLMPQWAPHHVERIKELTRRGFYDGVIFHRVIDGFMAQTGDPTGTGTGGSKYPDLPAEFSNSASFDRGTIGAARSNDPDSANSQFFIDLAPAPFLNGKYTIWGQVIDGMDAVDKIKAGEPPSNPDKIVKMQIAADADDASKQAATKLLQAQQ
jgi:peptidylprolyl isomerase